ncbi:thialysine N-epsilon-acetyltransferase-like [Buteo buteo]|uniref:thialysine N-epsilon-acetyltransferase-like n=1 Tax=Buteo buteo TaxID=30397 RepID=UPI003EC06786
MEYRIRPCAASDCPQLLGMIRALAEFEEMPEQVAIGVPGGVLLGYGLFFVTHSTRWGPSLYLEDLYVAPPHRGKGIGSRLLSKIAEAGVEAGCRRLRLSVLDWNESARRFYGARGGQEETLGGWDGGGPRCFVFRGEALTALAGPPPGVGPARPEGP